ncbi:MAG: beta-ketoacyl-ACP synthase II [Candidatus Aminicenantes bacterium]|nr:beta-ketoacyl-ACP synthase II [Candidatus Aminicenantes bacterium]
MTEPRRVVVTGIGIVSPLGIEVEKNWESLISGRSGIARISKFDPGDFTSQIAGEVQDFDPFEFVEKRESRKMDPFIQYAVAAAELSIKDSGIDRSLLQGDRTGVYVGSGIGGIGTIEKNHETLMRKGPKRVSPFFLVSTVINEASGQISIRTKSGGPNLANATACSTGTHAIGDSFQIIARGDADLMLAGGSEAPITPLGLAGFCSMRALSTRNEAPEKASRPFDKERDGFVIAEGAVILLLEELDSALRRNAEIYAEIIGYGISGDAFHVSAPCPDGEGAFQSMKRAIHNAGLSPSEIGYINAHGTSTPWNDKIETLAIKRLFQDHAAQIPISSTKCVTGHMLGAAGGFEAAAAALALKKQLIPPTVNLENPDPECDLDYVPNEARSVDVTYALSNSFGFGGTNGTLLLKKFQE